MPMVPSPAICILFPNLHLRFLGSSTRSVRIEREDLGLAYRWGCMVCRDHLEVDGCSITAPLWDVPEGQGVNGIL